MMDLLFNALKIAQELDVQTNIDSLVLFSVSKQPSKMNKYKAINYVIDNPDKTILDFTDCGLTLTNMDLDKYLTEDEIYKVWSMASKRLIDAASGDVTAFIDNAHPASVFRMVELPAILKNPQITSINQRPKEEYASLLA